MSEIVKNEPGNLVGTSEDRGVYRAGDASDFTPQERDRLRALGGLDEASDGDLAMLFEVYKRTDLDPFLKQIYLVGRKTKTGGYRGEPERWETKWTVQSSIDGLRKVLFRFAKAEGLPYQISAPVFYDENGNPCEIWLKKWGNPAAAKVQVQVGDSVGYGLATWDEFVQTKKTGEPNSMWSQFGPTMLAKCAKAQAIRDVCDLAAGIYVPEEMAQAAPRVRQEATRVEKPALGGAGLDAVLDDDAPVETPQEIPQNAESTAQSAALTEALAGLEQFTTREDVTAFVKSTATSDDFTPDELEIIADAGRARWQEIGEK